MKFQRINMAVKLLTCLLILAAVAIQRNGALLGHEFAASAVVEQPVDSAVVAMPDGGLVINTTTIASDIKGFGGDIPLHITIRDGRIAQITPDKNAETPEFFDEVKAQLLPKWIGTPVDSVATIVIDGVTGATLSSNALNATIRKAIDYALKRVGNTEELYDKGHGSQSFGIKEVVVLLVILMAMILPLFIKDQRYRYTQLALNVVVLGLWGGTFLSYELLVNYLSNGVNVLIAMPWLLMIVAALVYPYFGKKSHYCRWICPFGSLQELAGRVVKYKIKLSPKVLKGLNIFQTVLWAVLMFIMCAGIYTSWMDYELFTAFLFRQAVPAVFITAGLFVLLSFVVMRPYCRFVCPTGCLFQIAQNTKEK